MREVLNAIFYLPREGCTYRAPPHDFPPWRTVYNYFEAWKRDGTCDRILVLLLGRTRKSAGRDLQPRVACNALARRPDSGRLGHCPSHPSLTRSGRRPPKNSPRTANGYLDPAGLPVSWYRRGTVPIRDSRRQGVAVAANGCLPLEPLLAATRDQPAITASVPQLTNRR